MLLILDRFKNNAMMVIILMTMAVPKLVLKVMDGLVRGHRVELVFAQVSVVTALLMAMQVQETLNNVMTVIQKAGTGAPLPVK